MTQKFLKLLIAVGIVFTGSPATATAEDIAVSATPQPFHLTRPERQQAGKLLWRGGLELKSRSAKFGGFSSLTVADDLGSLISASDDGQWFRADLSYDADGRLIALSNGIIHPIVGLDGAPLQEKHQRDAESLAREADGGLLLSFERNHRVWRYSADPLADASAPSTLPTPKPLTTTFGNGGIETLVTLRDGRILAITEAQVLAGSDNQTAAYLWDETKTKGAKTWKRLRFQREGSFKPTGAARLPGGDILVLERSFAPLIGVAMRLRRIAAADIEPGQTLEGEELAVIRPPLTIDNMEGIDVKTGPNGETLVYLLSDNNFSVLQRTLLLLFELQD